MPLATGTRIGPYEVTSAIGQGHRRGLSRAGREVAARRGDQDPAGWFASDPDRLARFEREAQTLAALNHPNIAQVFGVVEQPPALVMELVEGEDLAQRLRRGAIPLDECLTIARQIAEGLEAAHDRGIVHRDLKPANIKIRDDSTVKVLDFGLAKAIDLAPEPSAGLAEASPYDSPTFTSPPMTRIGMVIGTAAYMSPEQVKGKPVDKRRHLGIRGRPVRDAHRKVSLRG